MPTVREWFTEIEEGLKYRTSWGREGTWAGNEAAFYEADANKNQGPNLTFSTGDTLMSAVSVPYPRINVIPERPEFIEGAKVVEYVDNLLVRKLELTKIGETAALHAFLFGKAIVKLGYDSEFGYDPDLTLGEIAPDMTLSQFDEKGNRIEFGPATPGMPWAIGCLPHDIIVPWGTRDISDAPWIVHRVVRLLDDVKKDRKYMNTRNLKPSVSLKDFVKSYQSVLKIHHGSGKTTDVEAKYVEIFEIHDRRTGDLLAIATGNEKFIRKTKDQMQIDGLPFVGLSFTPRTRTFWTTPGAFYLKHAQAELLDISLQASKQRRLTVLKFLIEEGAIDIAEAERFLSGDVGAIGFVKPGFANRDAIFPLTNVNNFSIYQDDEHVRRNAREVIGLSRNQQGEFEGTGRRTATEASIVDRGAQMRSSRRFNAMRKFYTEIIEKINQIIFTYWTSERVAEIVGEDNAKKWISFTGPQIEGEYALEVVFSPEEVPGESAEKFEALELYQLLSQNPNIDPQKLATLIADVYNDPKMEKLLNANIPSGMQGVRSQGGGLPKTNTQRAGTQTMQKMPRADASDTGNVLS